MQLHPAHWAHFHKIPDLIGCGHLQYFKVHSCLWHITLLFAAGYSKLTILRKHVEE